jgi:hypothetical protein
MMTFIADTFCEFVALRMAEGARGVNEMRAPGRAQSPHLPFVNFIVG